MPKKRKGGRVTPSSAGNDDAPGRRPLFRGPNAPIEGPIQAGKRPSSPGVLLLIAAAWIGCGVIALVSLTAGWKLIPGVVFIGIGVLFLRGAAATVVRRNAP